jgi:hypothetical protein
VTQPIPVTTSGDLDEILYADTKRCPHLKVLMQASEAMLKGKLWLQFFLQRFTGI